jgi:hypothetical protein
MCNRSVLPSTLEPDPGGHILLCLSYLKILFFGPLFLVAKIL